MESNDKYTVKLSDLSKDTTRYEFHLDNEFFSMVKDATIEKGDLLAVVTIKKGPESFRFDFSIKGKLVVTCDRCLDDMNQAISTEDYLTVKYGTENQEESDTVVVVSTKDDTIDLAWYMYEFIALNIPMRHVHPEGQCNQEMESRLAAMTTTTVREDNDSESEQEGGEDAMDPRWEILRKLKNDDNKE